MNISKIHILRAVAALLLCVVAASCSQDDIDVGKGGQLEPGKYPLALTASVDGMKSRAEGKNEWKSGDAIAVQIGSYPKLGHYKLTADGAVMSAVVALDWQTLDPATVTAWYPYLPLGTTKTVSVDDQSKGYEDYDFLTAIAVNQDYQHSVPLLFKHQMAKVSCQLIRDEESITGEEWETVELHFGGFTEASFCEGKLEGSYKGGNWVTPYYDKETSYHEALLVPQDMTDKDLIKIDLTVNVNGYELPKTLTYTPGKLEPGKHYKFNVTVRKDRLVVNKVEAEWNDSRPPYDAQLAIFKVYLKGSLPAPSDEDPGLIFSENVLANPEGTSKIQNDGTGNFILVKGNHFTISYKAPDEDGEAKFSFASDTDTERNEMTPGKTDGKYKTFTFSFYLRSEEITLNYVYKDGKFESPNEGDYYFSDGTWGSSLEEGKTCLGIVYKVGKHDNDNSDYLAYRTDAKDIESYDVVGYVVALEDASSTYMNWCQTSKTLGLTAVKEEQAKNLYDGYACYNTALHHADYKDNFYAINAIVNYQPNIATPSSCSGWYLPAAGQLLDIFSRWYHPVTDAEGKITSYTRNNITGLTPFTETYYYWSSTPGSSSSSGKNIWTVNFSTNSTGGTITSRSKSGNTVVNQCYVRAVLTILNLHLKE